MKDLDRRVKRLRDALDTPESTQRIHVVEYELDAAEGAMAEPIPEWAEVVFYLPRIVPVDSTGVATYLDAWNAQPHGREGGEPDAAS